MANLILCGPYGTGRTLLAVSIIRARFEALLARYPRPWWEVEADGSVYVVRRPPLEQRFVVVPTLLDTMRSRIGRRGESDDPLAELFDADLVVLDDCGAERSTDWATERLYALVSERYNRMRRTVVTTNFGLDELAARGYGAIVSRLLEDGAAIRIEASDFRLRGAA